jgi:hypothetical protein
MAYRGPMLSNLPFIPHDLHIYTPDDDIITSIEQLIWTKAPHISYHTLQFFLKQLPLLIQGW